MKIFFKQVLKREITIMDSADEDANENCIHEISKKQRFDRLLFPKDFPGANSKERMAHLHEITEEVQGDTFSSSFTNFTYQIRY